MSSFATTRTRRSLPSRPPRFRASTTVSIRPRSPARSIPQGSQSGRRRSCMSSSHEEVVDEVILAYSDLSHEDVMHKASIGLCRGGRLHAPRAEGHDAEEHEARRSRCAVRTGCGKSQTSRRVGQLLMDAGLSVALVRHPMPYGDLEAMRVQRFATIEDIDASGPDGRRAGGVRGAGRARHGDVRGRRLRGHSRAGAGRGRRRHLGWRKQRFPFYAPDLHVWSWIRCARGTSFCTTPARRTSAWPISSS